MTWNEVLTFLSRPNGIAVAVGIILSLVVEYWPAFEALAAKWKRVVFFAASLIIPLLAAVLGALTAGWSWSWEATFWPALVAGVLAFGSGTALHTRKL